MSGAKVPGPWHFAGSGWLVCDDDSQEFGLSAVYDDEPAGRLIAAAPDLYVALLNALSWSHRQEGGLHWICSESFIDEECPCAALAKAEGQ